MKVKAEGFEMSISEQVKEIRNMISVLHDEKRYAAEEIVRQAAGTIEALSAKLAVANMGRSDRYYGGGWILCEDRLPEKIGRYYIVSVKSEVSDLEYTRPSLYDKDGFATRIDEKPVAWQPLPKPYRPQTQRS